MRVTIFFTGYRISLQSASSTTTWLCNLKGSIVQCNQCSHKKLIKITHFHLLKWSMHGMKQSLYHLNRLACDYCAKWNAFYTSVI